MPNPGSDEPLEKVTLNLYAADVQRLRNRFPQAWSTEVREAVHEFVKRGMIKRPKTVGDFIDD